LNDCEKNGNLEEYKFNVKKKTKGRFISWGWLRVSKKRFRKVFCELHRGDGITIGEKKRGNLLRNKPFKKNSKEGPGTGRGGGRGSLVMQE